MTVYPLSTFPWKAFVGIIFVTTILPLSIAGSALFFAHSAPDWILVFVLSVTLGFMLSITIGLSALLVYVITRNEVSIRNENLHIKAGFYHQRIPLEEICNIQIIDLRKNTELQPKKRKNGIHLPGYQVGWFALKNNVRAFILLTTRKQAVYLSSNKGFSLLLSIKEPNQFTKQLITASSEDVK